MKQAHIYMVGIGGTGVVTANQILATAAMLEEKHATGVDQTGLSQKAGPVVSHLKILENEADASNTIAAGDADVYLAFDILASAAPGHLSRARPDKTTAVVSTSRIPTGRMVTHVDETFPELDQLVSRIDAHTRFANNVYLDATALARAFFLGPHAREHDPPRRSVPARAPANEELEPRESHRAQRRRYFAKPTSILNRPSRGRGPKLGSTP